MSLSQTNKIFQTLCLLLHLFQHINHILGRASCFALPLVDQHVRILRYNILLLHFVHIVIIVSKPLRFAIVLVSAERDIVATIRISHMIAHSNQVIAIVLAFLLCIRMHVLTDVQVMNREHHLCTHFPLSTIKIEIHSLQLISSDILESTQMQHQVGGKGPNIRHTLGHDVFLTLRTEPTSQQINSDTRC